MESTRRLDPGNAADLSEIFTYHAPDEEQTQAYKIIRGRAYDLASVIMLRCPLCADRTAALRLLRECVMTANAAIALRGGV
jgi:hypothetical protein